MKVNVHFGKFGASFYCRECGISLVPGEEGYLAHPTEKGIFKKEPLFCINNGVIVKDPFIGMELK